ncbi:MAG: ABC transporter ATP-binding protein [Bacteriovoracia bacterium]
MSEATSMPSRPLLEATGLQKHYPVKKFLKTVGTVKALSGVSFSVGERETLAVVGESGCGKTTLAKLLMRIEAATAGEVKIAGRDVNALSPTDFRKQIQMIFQDPYSSINPRKRAWQIISEPLRINTRATRAECRAAAIEAMLKVGLRPEYADRYPHMFSGGQRQRIGIARALILRPRIIICDEPVSALDVSIQAQVLNLLIELQREMGLSYIFISHDLSVVRHIADQVMVVYLGKVVEFGRKRDVFGQPKHPYTQILLGSAAKIGEKIDLQKTLARGELPSPMNPPPGCAFHKRCPKATELCAREVPALRELRGVQVACHFAE